MPPLDLGPCSSQTSVVGALSGVDPMSEAWMLGAHTLRRCLGGNQAQASKPGPTRRGRKRAECVTFVSRGVTPLRSQRQTDLRPQNVSPFETRELGVRFGKGYHVGL